MEALVVTFKEADLEANADKTEVYVNDFSTQYNTKSRNKYKWNKIHRTCTLFHMNVKGSRTLRTSIRYVCLRTGCWETYFGLSWIE